MFATGIESLFAYKGVAKATTLDWSTLNPASICTKLQESYGVISLDPNLSSQDSIIFADITRAFIYLRDGTPYFQTQTSPGLMVNSTASAKHYIEKNITVVVRALQSLQASDDPDTKLQLANLAELIQTMKLPESGPLTDAQKLAASSQTILVYKSKNGELALRFKNQAARDKFLQHNLSGLQGTIPQQFRVGPQYAHNPEGKTPVTYPSQNCTLFLPSYDAGGGEIGVNCGSEQVRSALIKALGFDDSTAAMRDHWDGKTYKDSTNKLLFSAYGGKQSTALYFERGFFTEAGRNIRFERVDESDKFTCSAGKLEQVQATSLAAQQHALAPSVGSPKYTGR